MGTRTTQPRDESGQAVVFVAFFLGLIAIGFLAFALDVGSLFRQRRMAQAAADAAALAASEEALAGYSSNEQTVANAMAKLNGFDTTLSTNPATVTLTTPSTGNFTGSAYVQAVVSRPIPTVFLAAFTHTSAMAVSAQATAGGQASQTCVCLEANTGQDLYLANGSKLSAPGCGLIDNSSSSNAIGIVGSTLTALSVGTVSTTWDNGTNINNGGAINSSHIVQGITGKCTPAMPVAPSYSSCLADPGGGTTSFTAGPASASSTICYTSLTLGANGTSDTLKPGTYVINGGWLTFESGSGGHSNLGGNGVFFYLTGGAGMQINAGANVNIVAGGDTLSGGGTAPTVGVYNGILIYEATGDTVAMSLSDGSTAYMEGAILAPSAAITVDNSSGSIVGGQIVASSLIMNGGGTLSATTGVSEGSLTIGTAQLVQ